MSDNLQEMRDKIDAVDEKIQRLISERAEIAQLVAQAKQNSSPETESAVFYRAEREAKVLRKIKERNAGPLSDEEMARLFREIMSACLALESKMKVAFLGPEGTFTQAAALKHFGHSIESEPYATITDVFREVDAGTASYGVVPIENSTEGVINHTLDEFINSSLQVCGEVVLRIHHHLLSKTGDLAAIKRIYSHQQSLAQCRHWLDANMKNIELINVNSNAEAAKLAAKDQDAAAIAGDMAAELYGLHIIASNVEDKPDNTTRFLVIGKRETPPSGKDKTSLLISSPNQSGALHSMLAPFAKNNITMTRIESRPSHRANWDYIFFVDIEGHQTESAVSDALHELKKVAAFVKVLGSYPHAVL